MRKFPIKWMWIIIFPLPLFLPVLVSGQVLYWGAPILQFFPWQAEAAAQLQQGVFPWWNFYNGGGAPLAANYQAGVFYPPNWLTLPFYIWGGNSWGAWSNTLVLLGHAWFGAIGMALFRKRAGFSEKSQILGAMLFPLSGYFIARINFFPIFLTGAWLPWMLVCAHDLAAGESKQGSILRLSITSALVFLAGHAQTAILVIVLSGLWVIFYGLMTTNILRTLTRFGYFCAAVCFGAMAASIQLIPTFEYLQLSQRANALDYTTVFTYSFSPLKILTLFLPDLFGNPGMGNYYGYATYWEDAIYIGAVPALFAIFSFPLLTRLRKCDQLTRAVSFYSFTVIIIGLVLAFGDFTPIYPYLYSHIPGFDMFKAPARWLLLVETGLILLACLGLDKFERPHGRGLFWGRLATAGAGAISLGTMYALVAIKNIPLSVFFSLFRFSALAMSFGFLKLFAPKADAQPSRERLWLGCMFALVFADLLFYAQPLIPRSTMNLIPDRIGELTAPFSERLYMDKDVEQQLKINRFFRFSDFRPIEDMNMVNVVSLPNINLFSRTPMLNNFDPIVLDEYEQWMDKVQQVDAVTRVDMLRKSNVGKEIVLDVADEAGVKFIPVDKPIGISLVACPVWVKNNQEALELITTGRAIDRIVIAGQERWCQNEELSGNIKVDYLTIQVQSSRSALLYLPMAYYPGWRAIVDGKPVELMRANYLFSALPVSEGSHQIKLVYQPDWLLPAVILSVFTWAGLCFSVFRYKLKRKMEKSK